MVICYVAVPEIEQGLADTVGSDVTISFTPNLMPMVIICTDFKFRKNIIALNYVSELVVINLFY